MTSDVVSAASRLWGEPDRDAAPFPVIAAVAAVALVGGVTLRPDAVGLAALLTGTAVLAVAFWSRGRRPGADQLLPALAAVALLATCAVRGAEWLAVLCLGGAWLLGTLALVQARTWTGLALGSLSAGLAGTRTAAWFGRRLRELHLRGVAPGRALVVAVVSGLLVAVFGALFAAADPAYASLLGDALTPLSLDHVAPHLLAALVVAAVTGVATYLARRPPAVDALAPAAGKPVGRWEWAVPLLLVDLLFGSFVAVQLTVLFGGSEHVVATAGLSYAEYARHGFWQLLVVTALTLAVIAVAVRKAPRLAASDRLQVRVLLGLLCLLSLVVVASAVHRMSLYEDQYGYTRLRVFVTAVEVTLGAVFVLLMVAGLRLQAGWLPRAVVALGALLLLALGVLNPDAYIARQDVARYERTGQIDVAYLRTLSADAVPALDRLPAALRSCALLQLDADLAAVDDPWWDGNLARSRARSLLAARPLGTCFPS
jgi:hypothetical protein